jgi:hypothetical protein
MTKAQEKSIPEYSVNIHKTLIEKGWKPSQLKLLAPMIATLNEIKCSKETIDILCLQEEFVSLDKLPNTKYCFSDCLSFGISPDQARLLETKLPRLKKLTTGRFNIIKSICQRRQNNIVTA